MLHLLCILICAATLVECSQWGEVFLLIVPPSRSWIHQVQLRVNWSQSTTWCPLFSGLGISWWLRDMEWQRISCYRTTRALCCWRGMGRHQVVNVLGTSICVTSSSLTGSTWRKVRSNGSPPRIWLLILWPSPCRVVISGGCVTWLWVWLLSRGLRTPLQAVWSSRSERRKLRGWLARLESASCQS